LDLRNLFLISSKLYFLKYLYLYLYREQNTSLPDDNAIQSVRMKEEQLKREEEKVIIL